jgi:hypothetical protein
MFGVSLMKRPVVRSDNKLNLTIVTRLSADDFLTTEVQMVNPVTGLSDIISRKVVAIQDEHVRELLEARGWTPPKDS